MNRRLSLAAAGATVLLAISAVAYLWVGHTARLSSEGIPLFEVERGVFIRTAMAEGYLRAVEATPITVPRGIEGILHIAWIAPDGSRVGKGDLVARLDTTLMEKSLADGADDLEQARLRAVDTEDSGEKERKDLLQDARMAEREAELAETFAPRDPGVFSRREILDSEIDLELAREKIENIHQRGDAVSRQGGNRMDLLGIERSRAELALRKARKGLASAEIRAPHDGMLVLTRNWEGNLPGSGMGVWPGRELAELPDPSRMQVVAYVLEADATGLKANCRATLVVEAFPGKAIPAKVEQVDPLAKSRVWGNPVQYFEVLLTPEAKAVEGMKPGLRAQAEIVLQETPGVLMVPPQAVFLGEGKEKVFRREGSGLTPVEVKVGDRGLARVVVLRGLKEGDEVALRDPRSGPLKPAEKRPGAKTPLRGSGSTP